MSSGKLGKLSEENILQAHEDLKKSSELASQHASAVSLSAGGVWTAASQADFGDMGKSVEKLLTEGAASMGVAIEPAAGDPEGRAPTSTPGPSPSPAPSPGPNPPNPKGAKGKTDVPSLRNTAHALQSRELTSLEKRFDENLRDGVTAITSSELDQDADFLAEAQQRMAVGYAWLGQSMVVEGLAVTVKPFPEDSDATDEMLKLMDLHFCMVSKKESLRCLKSMQNLVSELKTKTNKEGLDESVKAIQALKEQAGELISSIMVGVKDLKKHHKRRQADKAKADSEAKKRQKVANDEKTAQEIAEVKRSTLLATLQVPFTINGDAMQTIQELKSISEADFQAPFLITSSFKQDWDNTTMMTTMAKWWDSFQKDKTCQKQRCVSAPVSKVLGSDICLESFDKFLNGVTGVKFMDVSGAPGHMQAMMGTASLLGFLDDCVYYFLELEMTGSLRYQYCGEVEVMIARVAWLCVCVVSCYLVVMA